MICDYGCEQTATVTFKNGKNCCSKNTSKCPVIKKLTVIRTAKRKPFERIQCGFCDRKIRSNVIGKHSNSCYLNPKNKRDCPICRNSIKDWKHGATCSKSCANKIFKVREKHPNWKGGSYIDICFSFHKKECIICSESNCVDVHYFDKNRENNKRENLIPLCPTHHYYIHRGFYHLVKEQIEDFIEKQMLAVV